ncbi:PRC-barrel domain-containing protein [Pedobacter insulae]|uniref:PRC-barrel domain-containing protein n=1 Tax=Pedobacter insulae TaxID=414048 RepID=A0A1I2YCC0_9SPHI|nr:PRC-barrel domain-containing protein [Pedobacter insulae]SFH23418.1 PRC-barrel domain-containing protein [Pedobacter insulae]
MLLHAKELLGFSIAALDGEIGSVKDIYFDDHSWVVRYLVIETGNWLFKRKVLISPAAISAIKDTSSSVLSIKLTKQQIKNSPPIDMDKPVSRQQESSLFDHYSWPSIGGAGMGWPTTGMVKGASALVSSAEPKQEFDPHLRSFHQIAKYEVHNQQGRVGLVKNIGIDISNWSVSYLLIDDVFTSAKESVVITPNNILSIDWPTSKLKIANSQEDLKKAPIMNAEGFFSNDSEGKI